MNTELISSSNIELKKSLLTQFKPSRELDLEDSFDLLHFNKHQVIYYEGNSPFGVYYITSGKVKICRLSSDGREQILRINKPGEFIGIKDLLLNTRYSDSAEVIEEATLYFIPREYFLESLNTDPQLANKFSELLCELLLETENKMANCAYLPVRGRLAEALLSFKEYEDNDPTPRVKLTRHNLASYIGTAVETVVRTLTEFKEEKLVSVSGKVINILNTDGLQRVVRMYN